MSLMKYERPRLLLDEFFDMSGLLPKDTFSYNRMVPVEVTSDDKNIYVNAELPGIEKKEINIDFNDRILTISGEKKGEKKEEKDGYYYSEIARGKFSRSVKVGVDVDFENGKADYKDGVLKIILPKAKESKLKKLLIS